VPEDVKIKVVAEMDSNSLNRIQSQITNTLSKTTRDFDSNLQRAEKRILSFTSVAGIIYTVQKGFTELVKSTIEIEKSLTDINVIVNTSSREMKKFGDELFKVAKETNQTFSSVAKAATEFSRQGLSLNETLTRTRDALRLTQLAGISAEDAVDSLTATVNSFNKSMLTSTDIVNKFAAVDAKFAVSSADLAEAVKRVGSSAQEAGVDLNQLIAIVTTAQQTTARGGAVIGNALKTIFQKIERPQTLEQLEALSVTTRELNGEMLPAIQILSNLAQSYDKLEQAQKSQIAEMVGGIYQVNVLKATLSDLERQSGSTYKSALNTATTAGDVAIQRSEELNKSLSSLINRAQLNFQQRGAGIFDKVFGEDLKTALKGINNMMDPEAGSDIGKGLAENIIVGLGKTLKNQGGALLLSYLTGVIVSLTSGIYKAVTEVTVINSKTREQEILQTRITEILKTHPILLNDSAMAQRTILSLLDSEIRKRKEIEAISAATSRVAIGEGFGISKTTGNLLKRAPNMADPIRSAINREIASGVPPSSVRVGSNPMLVSGNNPGGIGIYNTIDEPAGLSQGIARGVKEGANLKNYGIPNYASGPMHGFNPLFTESQLSAVYEKINTQEAAKAIKIVQAAAKQLSDIQKVVSSVPNLQTQIPSSGSGELSPQTIIKGVARLNQVITIANKVGADYENNVKSIPTPSSPSLVTGADLGAYMMMNLATQRRAQASNMNYGGYGISSAGYAGGANVKGGVVSGGYDPLMPGPIPTTPSNMAYGGYGSNISGGRASYGFSGPGPSSLGTSVLMGAKLPEAERMRQGKQSALSEWYSKTFNEKNAGKLVGASIVLPIITNTISEMIGTESRGARVAGAATAGLGNIVSGAVIGGQIGAGPGGAIAGATLTSLLTIHSVFKEWTSTLPELTKNLEDAKKKTSELESGFQGFIKASEMLGDTSINISQKQLMALNNQKESALTGFSAADRLKLNTAFLRGGQTEASRVYNEIANPEQTKNQMLSIRKYLKTEGSGLFDREWGVDDATGSAIPLGKLLNKKGRVTVENVRSAISATSNSQGKNLESLLIDNDQLREYVFRQVGKGNYKEALAGGLGGLGIEGVDFSKQIDDLLSEIKPDERPLFMKELFSGPLSKENLEKLKGSGQAAIKARGNIGTERFNLSNKFYQLGSRLEENGLNRRLGYAEEIDRVSRVTDLKSFKDESSLAIFKAAQGNAYTQAEGYKDPLGLLNLEYSQKRDVIARELQNRENVIKADRINKESVLKTSSLSSINESVVPLLVNFKSKQAELSKSGIFNKGDYDRTEGQVSQLESLIGNPEELKKYLDREIKNTSGYISNQPYGSEAQQNTEYLDLLRKINVELNQVAKTEESSKRKIKEDNEKELEYFKIKKSEILDITQKEEERAKKAIENQRKLNIAALEFSRITEAELAPQKLQYASSLYSSNKIGSSELDSARSGAMEAYRAAYGVNSQLESSNRYAAFKGQFTYNELDKMREMERAAVDLGATMKSSFADGFKAFSTGAASAGQAFKQFGMGVLDRISTIVSNISTNMLFGAIGNLLPTSGFGNLLSGSMRMSSGGLVTGGSGVKDDVAQMLAPGDFVVRKAAVNKYGTSFMANLNNSYDYNDPKHPTSGSFNIDPRLSSLALEDPNNPQNDIRRSREESLMSYIREKEQYDKNKANAMSQYRAAQNQRLIGAYISAGIMAGATGLSNMGSMKMPAGSETKYGNNFSSAYGSSFSGHAQSGVTYGMKFASGGSVPGSSTRADTVPTLLMGGEYVIRRDAVNRIGLPALNQINSMRYASGGLVGESVNNQSVNTQETANSFGGLISAINSLRASLEKPNNQVQSNGITNYINVSVTANKSGEATVDTSTKTQSKQQNSQGDVESLKKFSELMKSVAYEVVIKESKPGGLLRNVLAA